MQLSKFFLQLEQLFLAVLLLFTQEFYAVAQNTDCPKRCGDMTIQYPFGIGSSCSHDGNFSITCLNNDSSSSGKKPKAILTKFNLELLQGPTFYGNTHGSISVNSSIAKACADNTSNHEVVRWINSTNLNGSPFTFDSFTQNVLVSVGCDGMASFYDETGREVGGYSSACNLTAADQEDGGDGGCNGYRYCKLDVSTPDMKRYSIRVRVTKGNCNYAFISTFNFAIANDFTAASTVVPDSSPIPVLLHWEILSAPSTDSEGEENYSVKLFLAYSIPAFGTLILSCSCFWSCWFYKTKERRKEAKLRAKYFKGRIEQSLSDTEVIAKMKLFTISELKKATNNFNVDQVLGQGGQGTVYKGILTNGQVVAIKKSKSFDENQWKQFINEVILLSQVSHRHVVKLLGCCLDTKTPLLVYEFISNGTLSEHIRKEFSLTWQMRVQIASEAADAIAYLHYSSSTPIYHRDIKTTNILLDDKFQAKVADFGISKIIPANQTHMTTCVQGTFGYLDPEYFRSSQFSEKSDVYSFGAILVELLTGQQPIRTTATEDEERSLVLYFISSMNEANLAELLDRIILQERDKEEEIMAMADVAKQCLKPRGIQRPTMKEVATQLEALKKKSSSTSFIHGQASLEIENIATRSTLEIGNTHTSPVMHISHGTCDDQERPLVVRTQ